MRLLFTIGGGSASGHCNTMEIGSKPRKGAKKKGKRRTPSNANPMALSLPSAKSDYDTGRTTLGSHKYTDTFEYNSMTYTRQVKKTFHNNPEKYREFVQILSEVSQPTTNKIDLVERIIELFDGHPELIHGFSFFLPPDITMELQDDAIVVNVEENDVSSEPEAFTEEKEEDTDTVRYLRNVKWTYTHQADVYQRFMNILQDFNRKSIDEMNAATQVANLFEGQRDLVLGFNIFLNDDYKILEDDKRGYLIRHPCKKGMRAHYTPINVTEEYTN